MVTCVLVTGASGFVGRAVCQRALALGARVKGSHRSQRTQSLVPQGVERIQIASVNNNADWFNALMDVNVVIHLAGRVHIAEDSAKDPLATYREVNTAGTSWLARMAASAGVRRLVYVSTIKVNVETVILRPPLVYGQGVGANFLRLLNLVRRGIPLPLASVLNRRSLIYVKNLADAILTSATHPRANGRTFLVSDGDDISTPELVRRIAETMELPPRMFRCPAHLLEVVARILGKSEEVHRLLSSLIIDSERIRFEIGWTPRYTMLQGLRETVQWYLANESSAPEVSGPPDRLVPGLDPSARRKTR